MYILYDIYLIDLLGIKYFDHFFPSTFLIKCQT